MGRLFILTHWQAGAFEWLACCQSLGLSAFCVMTPTHERSYGCSALSKLHSSPSLLVTGNVGVKFVFTTQFTTSYHFL